VAQAAKTRIGGHLVVESLEALGADVVFGLPGIHALAIWEALRSSELQAVGLRTELSAGFAADGYARASPTHSLDGPGRTHIARGADGGGQLSRPGRRRRVSDSS
jgi:thiamine pyrophosphate-dependent acetolactate synthase large subunit-like protein